MDVKKWMRHILVVTLASSLSSENTIAQVRALVQRHDIWMMLNRRSN